MGTLSKLTVELGLDDSGFSKGLSSAKGALGSFGGAVTGAAGHLSSAFGRMTEIAGGFLEADVIEKGVEAFKEGISESIGEAEALQQTQLRTNAIFGKGAEEVSGWAEGAANSLGLSNNAAQTAADSFGLLFKNVGLTSSSLPGMSENMAGVVANVAAFNNADPTAVMQAIQSGLAGNMRSLKSYGIVISQADVATEAFRETGKKNVKDLTTAELVQARYNLIMKGTAFAQDAVEKRSKTLAGAMKIFHANVANLREELGLRLIPVLTYLVLGLTQVLNVVSYLMSNAIYPLISALYDRLTPAFVGLWNALQPVFDAFGTLANVIQKAWDGGQSFTQMLQGVPGPLQTLALGLIEIVHGVEKLVRAFDKDGLRGVLEQLPDTFRLVWDGLKNLGLAFVDFAGSVLSSLIDALSNVDWGSVASTAWGLLKDAVVLQAKGAIALGRIAVDIAGWALGKVVDLWGWLKGLFGGGPEGDGTSMMTSGGLSLSDVVVNVLSWAEGQLADFGTWLAPKLVAAVNDLTDLGSQVAEAVAGKLQAIDWTSVVTINSYNVGQAVGGAIHDAIIGAVDLTAKAADAIANLDWSTVPGKVATAIETALTLSGEAVAGLAIAIGSFIGGAIVGLVFGPDTDFGSVVTKIKTGIADALDQAGAWTDMLVGKGADLVQGLLNGWDSLKGTLTSYVSGLPGWVHDTMGDATQALHDKGGDLIVGIENGWNETASAFSSWVRGFPGWVHDTMGDATGFLHDRGVQLITGVMNGWTAASATLAQWAINFGSWVFGQVGDLSTRLWQRGVQLINGVESGWTVESDTFSGYATGLGSWVFGKIGDLGRTLWQKGVDLIGGVMSGWTDQAGNLQNWANNLGDTISGWIGDLSGVLYSAGEGVIGGLWSGMQAEWQNVLDWLSGLAGVIPGYKGPPAKDATILVGNGLLIMQGLGRGLEMGWTSVADQLSGYTAAIGGGYTGGMMTAPSGGTRGGGFTINGDVHLNVNSTGNSQADGQAIWAEFTRQAGLRFGV